MNAPIDAGLKTLANTVAMEDFDPSDPRIYHEDAWQPWFERAPAGSPHPPGQEQPIRSVLVGREI